MNRRDAMKSLLVPALSKAGVVSATEVSGECKLLILSFKEGCNLAVEDSKTAIRAALESAGMGHVKFLLCQGLESAGVIK